LRSDFDNLASIARAADREIAGERKAEDEARRRQLDGALLDAPFGNRPNRGNGSLDAQPAASPGKNGQAVCGGAA
jgi:hypothetical protein